MKLGKEPFYLYDEHHKKMISVEYCRDCGDKYFFFGLNQTIFENIRDKRTAKDIMKFKEVYNLFFDDEVKGQRSIFDYLD